MSYDLRYHCYIPHTIFLTPDDIIADTPSADRVCIAIGYSLQVSCYWLSNFESYCINTQCFASNYTTKGATTMLKLNNVGPSDKLG